MIRPKHRAIATAALLLLALSQAAAQQKPDWSAQERPIADQLRGLRKVPDDKRAAVTRDLALAIRGLPATPNKLLLAEDLANLATEGDFGRETLQEVAATLAQAVRESPVPAQNGEPAQPYVELATLARYEGVTVSVPDPQFQSAMSKLEAADRKRAGASFTLTDLDGKQWTLQDLRGKVVLVNFWATWCPPCRKEMPDMEALYQRFGPRGFVVLAISDEDAAKVAPFIAERKYTYPVLLDPGRKVNELFGVEGIPKTFVYGRDGKLAAQAIDRRTERQFLEMLKQAGLE